jgi:preprotein translocase SecE subunit
VGTFFRELLKVGVYKASQGRITRQVTFAALAVTIALGLFRLKGELVGLDPIVTALPARVTCTAKAGRIEAGGEIKVTGATGAAKGAEIAVKAGDKLADVARAIDAKRKDTEVVATVGGDQLVLTSVATNATGIVRIEAPAGMLQIAGLGPDGAAHGRNSLNLGLRFLIPGILLVIGVWMSYRVVNVPAFADFLIAVEAEMNKVSWPTRGELFRASMVVLIEIFALAFILTAYDLFWNGLLRVLHIV